MTINTASGARLFIGSTAIPTIANDFDISDAGQKAAVLAEFEADSYVEVSEIESLGEFGDTAEEIKFTSLANSRTRKLKGPFDAGNVSVTVGDDPSDEGQIAMIAALAQKFDYNFKVISPDALTLGGTGTIEYFYGKVMTKAKNIGNASNVIRRSLTVGINSPIIDQPPT